MKRAQIIGTGGYQPGPPITNADIEALVGPLPEDVRSGIAIEHRFWLIDPATGEHRENNSELAYKAIRQAIESAGLHPEQIDLLILATCTPEYHLPPVINLVQDRLGLERCATLELRSGGAGCVQGLEIARLFLEQGLYRRAVVAGSEAISPVLAPVFLGKDPDTIRIRDRMPLYMFGDGAGAVVLEAREDDRGLIGGATACIGGGRKPGILALGGGTHAPIHQQLKARRLVDLQVDVVGAGQFTPHMITEALTATLSRCGLSAEALDLCLIPEGNVGWMLDSLREAGLLTDEWRALEGKIFDNLAQTGAVGCAAVPLFLDHAWRTGRVEPGDRIMLMGVEATKWIYAGLVLDWTAPSPADVA